MGKRVLLATEKLRKDFLNAADLLQELSKQTEQGDKMIKTITTSLDLSHILARRSIHRRTARKLAKRFRERAKRMLDVSQ